MEAGSGDIACCLVTGATGFIGRQLVQRLIDEGIRVTALVRGDADLPDGDGLVRRVQGDLGNSVALKEAAQGADTVFHLAGKAPALAPTAAETAEYETTNVDGTRRALEAAAGARRFVFFSSVKATGDTPYGRSKLRAEELVLAHGAKTGTHAVCLRLSLVYGPGNKGNLYAMMRGIDRGFFPPIADVGNRRSMVHVSNVVQAALLAARNPAANGKRYVVADQAPYSTRELYERMCGALGKPIPRWNAPVPLLEWMARVGDAIGRARRRRFFFDSDALGKLMGSEVYVADEIARDLGYRPAVSLSDALPEMVAAYRGARA